MYRYVLIYLVTIHVIQFNYGVGKNQLTKLQEEVQDCNTKIFQLNHRLLKQDSDILHLREEVKNLLTELYKTRSTLKDIMDKL